MEEENSRFMTATIPNPEYEGIMYCEDNTKPVSSIMALDLSSFKKAISSLENALTVYTASASLSRSDQERDVLRAGVIQNFEFTYELSWKFMKRWLEINVSPTIDGSTRKELFRIAAENRLIDKVEAWMQYHQSRNETSHTYDTATAEEIYTSAVPFLKDAKALLGALETEMINMGPHQRLMIETILNHHIPNVEVRAFGSRVSGNAKPYSDLDLVVRGSEKLPLAVLYRLRNEFEESDIPFRIDILDWNRLSPEFKHAILSHSEVLR